MVLFYNRYHQTKPDHTLHDNTIHEFRAHVSNTKTQQCMFLEKAKVFKYKLVKTNMNFPFKKQIPQNYPQRRNIVNDDYCEVKIKRDKNGNIISKKISKNCTPQQVRALVGLDGREDNIVTDD